MAAIEGRLYGIQILRLISAAMVLLQHAFYLPSVAYSAPLPNWLGGWLGAFGVYLFFLISGFVIAGLIDTSPARFALHRLVRIYPPLFASLLIGGALTVASGVVPVSDVKFSSALLLLPIGGDLINWSKVMYWTLMYEMLFYFVTFVLMLGPRNLFDWSLAAWVVLILLWNRDPAAGLVVVSTSFIPMLTSPMSLFFIAGAMLARLHRGNPYPLLISVSVAFGYVNFANQAAIGSYLIIIGMMLPVLHRARAFMCHFRVALYDDGGPEGAAISYDRPSSFLASFGRPELVEIGLALDRKIDGVAAALRSRS